MAPNHRCAQFSLSGVRFPCQLCADDVVLPADSVLDLQTALDAVSEWGRKWRFTFGISPTKSAVMIIGPRSRVPSCAVTLANSLLPVVNEYTYLGVVLTRSLTWLPPVHFAASLFRSYVLPSIFLPQFEHRCSVDRQCSAQVGSSSSRLAFRLPNAAVFLELGWPDAQHLCTERLLSLFSRAFAMPSGERCPLPALIFHTALCVPGSWASLCVALCRSLGVPHASSCCIGFLSSARCVQAWFQTHAAPPLNRSLRDRLVAAASSLSVCHVHGPFAVNAGPHQIVYGRSCSSSMLDSGGSLAGVTTRFQGVELRGTSGSHCRALCVKLHLVTCSTVCQNAPPCLIFETSGVVSVLFTQIPFLSGFATLGSSFQAPPLTLPD